MMRIGFISTDNPYIVNNGGIGSYTRLLAEKLAQGGEDVHLFTLFRENTPKYLNGVKIHTIQHNKLRYMSIWEISYLFYIKFDEVDRQKRFDVLEAPEWIGQGCVISYESTVPIITRLHTPLFLIKNICENQRIYWGDDYIVELEKKQCKNSSVITSPSIELLDIVKGEVGVDGVFLPNGINVNKYNISNTIGDYILFMGRLEYRKGITVLSEAMRQIFEENKEIRLVLCGQDSLYRRKSMLSYLYQKCEKYKDRIVYFDYADDNKKIELMNNANIVVLPSVWENCSYVALEAMSLGKVVVCSDTGGFREMIIDQVEGFKFESGNVQQLVDKIKDAMECNHSLIGMNARTKIRADYNIEIVTDKYKEIIKNLI